MSTPQYNRSCILGASGVLVRCDIGPQGTWPSGAFSFSCWCLFNLCRGWFTLGLRQDASALSRLFLLPLVINSVSSPLARKPIPGGTEVPHLHRPCQVLLPPSCLTPKVNSNSSRHLHFPGSESTDRLAQHCSQLCCQIIPERITQGNPESYTTDCHVPYTVVSHH